MKPAMMVFWLVGLVGLLCASCAIPPSSPVTPELPALPDLGVAPELENQIWLNTETPLQISSLKGKVILLEMWTFGCINCRNVIPTLKEWHVEYKDQGLVVIGNHFPEFGYEEDLQNLKQAITDLDIPYAISQDNEGLTWRAYETMYWPTIYLIDKAGHIRYSQIGEGNYDQTEQAIRALLAEN